MRTLFYIILLGLVGAGAAVYFTLPSPADEARFAGVSGDAVNGEVVFHAGGCASCHAAPESEDKTRLPGGERFVTDFGTFIAPNISQDEGSGIGGWTLPDFANAMQNGVSPEGQHYYPAFPYTSYTRMTDQDVADLFAYMQTLPAVAQANAPHELALPFQFRELLGPWKALYVTDAWRLAEADTPEVERGRYLVEALGHCGECHTSRNIIGAPDQDTWLAGAPNPSGDGRIPGINPQHLTWSEGDIAYYLETGFTPDFDSAGGSMTSVVQNTAQLSPEDRAAIAAYLKAIPGN